MSLLFGILASVGLLAQQHHETIKKTMPLPQSDNAVLVIENVFGSIEVEGYEGTEVIFEIENEFSADTSEELEKAMKKVFLAFEIKEDTLDVFPNGTCGCRQNRHRNFDWSDACDFKYKYDFKVKVPVRANINVSTVVDGKIEIKNIQGNVVARNVNGDINMDKITGSADVNDINGNVEVRYIKSPNQHSKYYSLNGNVNVYYPSDLSADMSFKSFQGEMYTNFEVSEWLPPLILSTQSKDKNSTKYKVENKLLFRVGKGGIKIDFETFNGDVFVRKI
jgi:hypothetical protein